MDYALIASVLLVGTGFILLSRLVLGTALAPPGAYSVVWLVCCLLLALKPAPALHGGGFAVIMLAWLAFGVGALLPMLVVPEVNALPHAYRWRDYLDAHERRIAALLSVTNTVSIGLGLLALAMAYLAIRGAGQSDLAVAAMNLRHAVGDPAFDPGIDYSRNVLLHTVGLGVVYFTVFVGAVVLAAYPRRTIAALLPLAAVMLFSLAKFNREHLLDAIIAYGAAFWLTGYLAGRPIGIPWRVLVKVSVPLVAIIVTLSVALGKFGTPEGLYDVTAAAADHAHFRLTVPLENLDRYVAEDSSPWLLGQATLNPLYRALYAVGLTTEYTRIDNRGPSPINGQSTVLTYSYLKWPYDDFGRLGPPVVAFLFGLLAATALLAARHTASFALLLLNVVVYVAIGYSFATWRFQDLFIVVALACIALLHLWVERGWRAAGERLFRAR